VRALWRSGLVLVVLGAAAGGTSARASVVGHGPPRLEPASRVVLGSSFQPISGGGGGIQASGDYVLLSSTFNFTGSTGWAVINQRLGTTTTLDPQCRVLELGPPWVLMSCPPESNPSGPYDLELYSLTDGTRQTVTPSPGLPPQCPLPDVEAECASVAGVGAYWIRWDASCYNCAVASFFQNIQTGELRSDPTNATTFADLNSPTLARSTCPGVRVMAEPDSPTPWGSLTYDGQFALVGGIGPFVFLERCGTRMRRQLIDESSPSTDVAWSAGAVVWQSVTSQLDGLFLPSLQRFTIPLPSVIVKPPGATESTGAGFVLTSDTLYVRDGWYGRLWQTATPTALPLNTRGPSVSRSGSTLTCKRGRWRNADQFSYAWLVNASAHKGGRPTLAIDRARGPRRVSCSVTASNTMGTTTASSAPLHLR
jgi:hypothetical protein